jgi:diguanylate cyclase (GGDEF)-like protein/PAS domain S-box-containing protein
MAGKVSNSSLTPEESRQDTVKNILQQHDSRPTPIAARDVVQHWSSIGEQQALFRYLLDQLNDGIWIIDPDSGVILDANRAAYKRLGYTKEDLVGKHLASFVSELPYDVTLRQYMESRGTNNGMINGYHRHRDGSRIPMETNARLIELDSRSYVVAIARDITDRKRLEDELRQLSTEDSLTNVFNRRYFDDMLEQEWRRMMRVKHSLGLLMIDVDYFKHFNDTYGHVGGDACLRQIATEMKNQMRRAGDIIARYGGEEFAVILPETDIETAAALGDTLQQAIKNLRLEHVGIGDEDIVTVSVGVATLVPTANQTSLKLLTLSDKALYAAKASGRNRVHVWRG